MQKYWQTCEMTAASKIWNEWCTFGWLAPTIVCVSSDFRSVLRFAASQLEILLIYKQNLGTPWVFYVNLVCSKAKITHSKFHHLLKFNWMGVYIAVVPDFAFGLN